MPPILSAATTDTWPFEDTVCGVFGYFNIVLSFAKFKYVIEGYLAFIKRC